MTRNTLRVVALAGALAFFSTSISSCGYILYPHQRGNKGGKIHTPSLVMDILWLLPGIIPGVIALAVDFSTGAVYEGGGPKKASLKTKIRVVRPKVASRTSMEVRVKSSAGRLLFSRTEILDPGSRSAGDLTFRVKDLLGNAVRPANRPIRLQFQVFLNGSLASNVTLLVI